MTTDQKILCLEKLISVLEQENANHYEMIAVLNKRIDLLMNFVEKKLGIN